MPSRKRLTRAGITALTLLLAACGGGSGTTPDGGGAEPTPPMDMRLGVQFDAGTGQAVFKVWAPHAAGVQVRFYDAWNSTSSSAAHAMAKDLTTGGEDLDTEGWNGVWTATVSGVPQGQLYLYDLDGTLALDPYAPSMGRLAENQTPRAKGAVVDVAAVMPLDLGTGQPSTWAAFTAPPGYQKRQDAVVYEVDVRDFTILDQSLAAAERGTYVGFARRVDRVAGLHATHLQLLPIQAFYNGDEGVSAATRASPDLAQSTANNNYNWGYDPYSFSAPTGHYASDPADPVARVAEVKTLVNEAHRSGLGVTMDVVYNHMPNMDPLRAYSTSYFRDGANDSWAGVDLASERKMMRKLLVDTVTAWTRDYKIDGFRFDLMGIMDSVSIELAYASAAAENPHTLFIGEGWRMWNTRRPTEDYAGNPIVPAGQDWMTQTDHAAVFSDSFRDIIKGGGLSEDSDTNIGFLTSMSSFNTAVIDKAALLRNLRGDATNFTADHTGDAVEYLTAHDGLTLHDKIAKLLSLDPDTQRDVITRIERLGFTLMATSQGIQFLNGGCEWGRSKRVTSHLQNSTSAHADGVFYVYNSYDATDYVNGFNWTGTAHAGSTLTDTHGQALRDYVSGLFALRAATDAFRQDLGIAAVTQKMTPLDLTRDYGIAYKVVDGAGTTGFYVFVNAGTAAVDFATGGEDLTGAAVLVDDDEAGATPVAAPSGFSRTATAVTVSPRTAVVLRMAQ